MFVIIMAPSISCTLNYHKETVIFVQITKTNVQIFLVHVMCIKCHSNYLFLYIYNWRVLYSAVFNSLADRVYMLIVGITSTFYLKQRIF